MKNVKDDYKLKTELYDVIGGILHLSSTASFHHIREHYKMTLKTLKKLESQTEYAIRLSERFNS